MGPDLTSEHRVLSSSVLAASLMLASLATADEITGPLIDFDIPAQLLTPALDAYGRATGMATLVDQALTAGRRSSDLKGRLTPDQGLRVLLAGTGLSISYASGSAFTLEPTGMGPRTVAASLGATADRNGIGRAYFADLQDTLIRTLCRKPETRPGRYRLGLQLWIGPGGDMRASHLLDSSGNAERDAAILESLRTVALAPPPAALPQPITIVLLPRTPSSDCPAGEGRME
jgi:hypothetical protein